ncbi:hypothetical protein [Enterococcus haemoperoxidus]|uniref:hypothetical protein n=1 Tax=Enterococcus haemoperoxidus TaxID=155618 RepID=UPI0015758A34|nr:hypothetical protein [Enterococcus haemoperoxidus]
MYNPTQQNICRVIYHFLLALLCDSVPQNPGVRVSMSDTFYPDRRLAASADTNPDGNVSPALDYYNAGMATPI